MWPRSKKVRISNSRIGFCLEFLHVLPVSVWAPCRFCRLFSHNVTVADKCMQPIMVFCTHLTAHTAFDTSITQPVENKGCMHFSAGSKSLLPWRAHIPYCYFMTLYGGKLLHVQRCALLNGLQVWMWGWMVVCLLQPETPTEYRMSIEWRDFFYLIFFFISVSLYCVGHLKQCTFKIGAHVQYL